MKLRLSCLLLLTCKLALAQNAEPLPIDLESTLRLAGAQNLDIAVAQSGVREAEAAYAESFNRFLPFLQPSLTAHHHDGQLQDIAGNVAPVDRSAATVGASLNLNLALGDAIYRRLEAKQLVDLARARANAERSNTITDAAQAYLDLARAQDAIAVAEQAVTTAQTYADEVNRAVDIGLTSRIEAHRVQTRVEQNRGLLVQARAERRIAAARLAQVLHLEPAIDLIPGNDVRAPLALVDAQLPLSALLARAQTQRPELKAAANSVAVAETARDAVRIGPRYPSLNARANLYGLNGGPNGQWSGFGNAQDYTLELSWRIGPGGLFDRRRERVANARTETARLQATIAQDDIATEVVSAFAQRSALREQVDIAERALSSAQAALDLALARREFGVSAVLEVLLAEEALTQTRLAYLSALARFNQAEFELKRATGE